MLLLVTLGMAACGTPVATPKVTPARPTVTPTPSQGRGVGGTLTILYHQAPTTLNPYLNASTKNVDASRITYEPLASFDKDGNLVPFLAAEIPTLQNGGVAADGMSVTWKLRRDVRWSDGKPFTAEDVLFTYQYIAKTKVDPQYAAAYTAVKDVQLIDQYTIKVNFKDVNPAWALPFVGKSGIILPRHLFEAYVGDKAEEAPANKMPVGTGPYRVVKFKTEEVLLMVGDLIETNRIVFEPNPYFREPDKPFFSRIEFKGGGTPQEAARVVLETGEVDYAWNLQLDAKTVAEKEALGKGKVLPPPTASIERMFLNFTDPNQQTEDGERSSLRFPHPFFSDQRVRQAFTYAIDRDAISKLYVGSRPVSNILVSPARYSSPNTQYEYNLKKAADLLTQAGWTDRDGDGVREKDGVKMKITFQTTSSSARQATQKMVQQALQSIGVEVELKIVDSTAFFNPSHPSSTSQFQADLLEYSTGNASPDPGAYMRNWVCDQIPQKANNWQGTNVPRWCNPTYDELYRQSTTEMDPEKRRQIFIQMNDILINEVVMIPLVNRPSLIGFSKTLVGVDPTPWDSDLWNIKDWRRVSL